MAPPKSVLAVTNSFKNQAASSSLAAKSMFTSNGDIIFINV
jgi:hypothetical protein